MRTAGIICEYNPFHWGHQYQISKTRMLLGEDTAIVCLMSGNYVQRGEPAIFDKRLRTEAALRGGADLVLELPITTAVNAAGYFAHGAVDYMDALGCIDYLSFGSEAGSGERLLRAAELLESDAYEAALVEAMEKGMSYAAARTCALDALGGDGSVLLAPNNALGVEYLHRLKQNNSPIKPLVLQREMELASASAHREEICRCGKMNGLPGGALYENAPIHTLCHGQRAMLAVLRSLPDSAFEHMAFEAEGLWSKVMKACRRENGIDEIILACKSKRYAYSRLRRTLLCLFLGLDGETMKGKAPYLRVLGFHERGKQVLHQMKETAKLPLISCAVPNSPEAKAYYALEQRASDLYGLFAPEQVREDWGKELRHRPVIL